MAFPSFPLDTDVEQFYIRSLVPEDIGSGNDYVPDPESLRTLSITGYTVRKGDSVSLIASSFGLTIDTLISFNKIEHVRKVYPGMKLRIPNTSGVPYTVRSGDCLSGIAERFSMSLNDLLDWNNIDSAVISPGQVLFIPGARMNKNDLARVLGTLFVYPVKGGLSSDYGWRIHPISGKKHFHNGIDITNFMGTPVRAAMAGRVVKIGVNNIYGKFLIIQHDGGFQTFYGHLNRITTASGAWVNQGQKVGEMGNTGYSTGPHLHFSIYRNGETVNPMKYLN